MSCRSFALAARSRAWKMSPEKPKATQMSPPASALMYSDEWNLRTNGRIALTTSAAFCRSSAFFESGPRPAYFSAADSTSVGLSSSITPQSANFDTTAGSNTMRSESTGASGRRFFTASTL